MESKNTRPASRELAKTLIAAAHAVAIATGILAVGFAIAAASNGQTIADLYVDLFPTFRGNGDPPDIPAVVYAIFIGYVVGAAQIAIVYRRRPAKPR